MDDLKCPRCGSNEIGHGASFPPLQGLVECFSDGCEVIAVADSEAEAIAIWRSGSWTHELVDRDEDGNPEYRPTGEVLPGARQGEAVQKVKAEIVEAPEKTG